MKKICNYIQKVFLISGYNKTLYELERLGYHKEYNILAKKIKKIKNSI